MRVLTAVLFATTCLARAQTGSPTVIIPHLNVSVILDQQPIQITLWGTVSPGASGTSALALTVDLGDLQAHLTPVLAAQVNRSDRCGDRLSVEHAVIAPSAPSGVLTANVNFERFACAKVFGKEVAKRLVGGHGVMEVSLTPSVEENDIALAAEVRKVDADGSLGEVMRSRGVGDSVRKSIAEGVESAIQKLTNLKSALPAEIGKTVTIETVEFADGGSGRLWLNIGGEARLTPEQLRATKQLAH
jgi:hypothetical protein